MQAIKKWLSRLIWAPALLLAVLFLVANRQLVSLSLDPTTTKEPAVTTPALPLWAWLMLMTMIGLAAGAAGMWASGRPKRVALREQKRLVKTLREDVTRLQTALREAEARETQAKASDADEPGAEDRARPPLLTSENV